jgi:hypothetical protein
VKDHEEVERLRRIMDAIEPFARAASLGLVARNAVKAADMSAVTNLVGTAGYCAQHISESHVSWAHWEALADAWNSNQ